MHTHFTRYVVVAGAGILFSALASACTPPDLEPIQISSARSALWNSLFSVVPTTDSLVFSGQDIQTSSLGEADTHAVALEDGGLTWQKPELIGHFFTVCAPATMPGVDPLDLLMGYTAGILGADLKMNITLTAAAATVPDAPAMILETGHYVYGDLGEATWHSDELSRTWTAREIASGVQTEYPFDRGAAWAAAHGISGENCGVASCADQDLPQAPFADQKTCVRLSFAASASDGRAMVATATIAELTLDYRAWGFRADFPRGVTLEYSCTGEWCSMRPELVASGEPGARLEYIFVPVSAPSGLNTAQAWYSMDGGATKSLVDFSDPAVYQTPIRAEGVSGLTLGGYDALRVAQGDAIFTFQLTSVAPTLATLDAWSDEASQLESRLDDNVRSFVDIRNLSNQLQQLLRQVQISLSGLEVLLVFSAHNASAKVSDLYYATGPHAGEPRPASDLPAWYTAAAADPNNLMFRRLSSIRAQLLAGQTITAQDRRTAINEVEGVARAAEGRVHEVLELSEAHLAKLVRWSSVLDEARRKLRDCLLLKTGQGEGASFDRWSSKKCAPPAPGSPQN